ncbi:PLP-dependent cysteine synthase family protein [Tsukamurella asaccharolytica]|uniref:PLP-dependent cysteine synthase family protein n=1 Tax=Tsukamurella asaccharolytica TaxID=2592067 RepID=UPI001E5C1B9B|nr:cysteine synthase family protein [Tsukamurella asaccharolytica]
MTTTPTDRRAERVFDSLADAVGDTPLVRLRAVSARDDVQIWAKLEYLNPGGSSKDRAAAAMILDAERRGLLRPGGTIVEGTSGNTGIALAQFGAARGYRTVVVAPDKTSEEKLAILRAHGAEVVIAPSGVPADHPDYVRNQARRIADSIDGGWLTGQYDNPANPAAHEATTGPEIWRQTAGTVTHLVAGIGTGGTITGTGRFLKAQGAVTVIGAEPEGSNYSLPRSAEPHAEGEHAWYIEAVGHFRHPRSPVDDWPDSYDAGVIDAIEVIPDATALATLHHVARHEGLLVGGSSGTALAAAARVAETAAPGAVIVAVLPDSGRAYLSKYFSPDWLARWGFDDLTAKPTGVPLPRIPTLSVSLTVGEAIHRWPDGYDSALVTLRTGPRTVAAEVAGSVRRSALNDADPNDPIERHVRRALVAGRRESLDVARSRLASIGPEPEDLVALSDRGFVDTVVKWRDFTHHADSHPQLEHREDRRR